MKKLLLWISGLVACALIAFGAYFGPTLAGFMTTREIRLDSNLTLFQGGGGNTLVLASDDGRQVLVIDTKVGRTAKQVKKFVDSLGAGTGVIVVNSHYDLDHSGGNSLYPGATLIAGDYPEESWKLRAGLPQPVVRIPVGEERAITVGNETVRMFNVGQAHTTHDVVVYLACRKLLAAGDLVFNRWHPVLQKAKGSHVAKTIRALDAILTKYDIQTVVPGHGEIGRRDIITGMRDYFGAMTMAADDATQINKVRALYGSYKQLPGMTSFNKVIAFIQAEKKEKPK